MNDFTSKKRLLIILIAGMLFIVTALITSIVFLIKADNKAEKARLTQRATIEITSVAEALKSSNGNLEKASQLLRHHFAYDIDGDILTLYYDDNFNPSTKSGCRFESKITKKSHKGYYEYNIKVIRKSSTPEESQAEKVSKTPSALDIFYELSFKAVSPGGV